MAIWFTADTHFDHKNVIVYAKRPFNNVDDMNEGLIKNWNELVDPKDEIYHLGDIAIGKPARIAWLVSRLNGRKHLVCGNHDKELLRHKELVSLFETINNFREIKIQDADAYKGSQRIVLLHYALRVWNKSHYGSYSLYGHSHGSLTDDPHSLSLDVGVDCWDYRPVSYDQIKAKMKLKTWKAIDHHGDRNR